MRKILYIITVSFIISCGNISEKSNRSIKTNDTVIRQTQRVTLLKSSKKVPIDTVINYSIEGLSSEGSEAIVHYMKGVITEANIDIYGETEKYEINYHFMDDSINVIQKRYKYNKEIENVNSKKDFSLVKKLSYSLNLNGEFKTKTNVGKIDIFKEFKKVVPFSLK